MRIIQIGGRLGWKGKLLIALALLVTFSLLAVIALAVIGTLLVIGPLLLVAGLVYALLPRRAPRTQRADGQHNVLEGRYRVIDQDKDESA